MDRLEEKKPKYGLDHLVKERYPTFLDALRDLDDPLTLAHLFAVLPADKRHGIPAEVVLESRKLSLEFQSYVTKMHALRKVFISVKGIYYQAVVHGQEITWLTPHALAQTLPEDVDYRVMLTFLDFYTSMLGFVNYKLYFDQGLRYPPVLDTRLEDAAGGIVAVIHDLADRMETDKEQGYAGGAKKKSAQAKLTESRLATLGDKLAQIGDGEVDEEAEAEAALRAERSDGEDDEEEAEEEDELERAISLSAGGDPTAREDAKVCATLFKGMVFFIQRECPRDMMVFIIRSFGGEVCWDGEGSPYDESDGGVTHHICDRPMEGKMLAQREYVVPQWVCDCANWRILIPCADYRPGIVPPPHLSPFVSKDDDGYTPDYQATLEKLQMQAKAAREGRSLADVSGDAGARMLTAEEEAEEEEREYARDLQREAKGIPYSRAMQEGRDHTADSDEEEEGSEEEESDEENSDSEENSDDEDDSDDEENSDAEDDSDDEDAPKKAKKRKPSRLTHEMAMREKDIIINKRIKEMGEDEEIKAMSYTLLPRKKRELYKAMQLGLAKKEARVNELKERAKKLKKDGVMDEKGRLIPAAADAAPAKKTKKKK